MGAIDMTFLGRPLRFISCSVNANVHQTLNPHKHHSKSILSKIQHNTQKKMKLKFGKNLHNFVIIICKKKSQ
jgi:hypothetical protein